MQDRNQRILHDPAKELLLVAPAEPIVVVEAILVILCRLEFPRPQAQRDDLGELRSNALAGILLSQGAFTSDGIQCCRGFAEHLPRGSAKPAHQGLQAVGRGYASARQPEWAAPPATRPPNSSSNKSIPRSPPLRSLPPNAEAQRVPARATSARGLAASLRARTQRTRGNAESHWLFGAIAPLKAADILAASRNWRRTVWRLK